MNVWYSSLVSCDCWYAGVVCQYKKKLAGGRMWCLLWWWSMVWFALKWLCIVSWGVQRFLFPSENKKFP